MRIDDVTRFLSAPTRSRSGARLLAALLAAGLLAASSLPQAHADPVKRKLLTHADPEYPRQAKQMHVEGSVIMRIVIEPDGHVSDVRIASGNPMLTDAAQAAAKQWKYSPASESSVSVVQVNFSLK
jgi:TonB family protein